MYLFSMMTSKVIWLQAMCNGIEISGCAIRTSCADRLDILITNKSLVSGKLLSLLQPVDTGQPKINVEQPEHMPALPKHNVSLPDFLQLKQSIVLFTSIQYNVADTLFYWGNCCWVATLIDDFEICAARILPSTTDTCRPKKNTYAHMRTRIQYKQQEYYVSEESAWFTCLQSIT